MSESYELNQYWRCPKCGTGVASGPPVSNLRPSCGLAHAITEMEQITAEGFGRETA